MPTARLLDKTGFDLIREAERDFQEAAHVARGLPELSPVERRRAVIDESTLPPIPLAAGILSVLPSLIHDSPKVVVDLCHLGLDLISPEGFDLASCNTASILAELEANLANAFRVLDQLPAAEKHMERALLLLEESPDVFVHGIVLMLAGRLSIDTRHFQKATSFANRSKALFARIGATSQIRRAELIDGLNDFFRGDFTSAIPKLDALAGRKDADNITALSAKFFLVKALVLSGAAFPAGALLPHLTKVAKAFPQESIQLQLSWLKGLILGSTRDPDAGEALMDRARRYYLEKGILYDAALVTLDMAMVRFEAGHYDQAAQHAASIIEAFAVSGVHREALTALRYFQEAVKAKEEARARYKELQVYLPLSRRDPTYSYRPGAIG